MDDNLRIDFCTAPLKCMQQNHTTCMGHSNYLSSATTPSPARMAGFQIGAGGGGILQRIPHNWLFTLGSVYSTDASGAEQMPETNNSYQT